MFGCLFGHSYDEWSEPIMGDGGVVQRRTCKKCFNTQWQNRPDIDNELLLERFKKQHESVKLDLRSIIDKL